MNSENILKNWNRLLKYVDEYSVDEDQKSHIHEMLKYFEDRFIDAPASSRPTHHNCFAGGLLDHTLRVIDTALQMRNMFELLGVKVEATESDAVLGAMFHDLGKIGDLDNPYYIVQTDEWRRNKLNEWYTFNDKLEPLSVTDRALWLLQHFDIKVSQEIWKAIKMSDGLFDEGNVSLYRKHDTQNILHYIVHFADWMSTVAEKQHYRQSLETDEEYEQPAPKKTAKPKTKSDADPDIEKMKKKFDELFN